MTPFHTHLRPTKQMTDTYQSARPTTNNGLQASSSGQRSPPVAYTPPCIIYPQCYKQARARRSPPVTYTPPASYTPNATSSGQRWGNYKVNVAFRVASTPPSAPPPRSPLASRAAWQEDYVSSHVWASSTGIRYRHLASDTGPSLHPPMHWVGATQCLQDASTKLDVNSRQGVLYDGTPGTKQRDI